MAAKSDVVVKLILVFFISLLSFSIGTFVGKKYSDNQHRLASLEPANHSRSVASTKEDGHEEGQAVSDEEIAKLAEEFAAEDTKDAKHSPASTGHNETAAHGEATKNGETTAHGEAVAHSEAPHGEAHPEAAHHEAPAPQVKKTEVAHEVAPVKANNAQAQTTKPSETAESLAQGKEVPEVKKSPAAHKERVPSSLPQDVAQYSVGKFTVQIASFPSEAEAKKRAEELKNKGFGAFYFPATVKGKSWYRVGVGLFPNEAEAVTYKKEFAEKTKIMDTVIQKIIQ